jgi:hypothetical protein
VRLIIKQFLDERQYRFEAGAASLSHTVGNIPADAEFGDVVGRSAVNSSGQPAGTRPADRLR